MDSECISSRRMRKLKYLEDFKYPNCDEATKYEKVAKIRQGNFG
jgi:hypothetical protein